MKYNSLFYSIICLIALGSLVGCNSASKFTGMSSDSLPARETVNSLAKGILGGDLGKAMDKKSMKNALQAEYAALEKGRSGFPVPWTGSTGFAGKVIPQQPYQVGSTSCRRYEHILQDRGTVKRATGTACRTSNGVWVPLT